MRIKKISIGERKRGVVFFLLLLFNCVIDQRCVNIVLAMKSRDDSYLIARLENL